MPRACFFWGGRTASWIEHVTVYRISYAARSQVTLWKAPNEPAQLHEPGYAGPKACALLYSANFTSGLPKRDWSDILKSCWKMLKAFFLVRSFGVRITKKLLALRPHWRTRSQLADVLNIPSIKWLGILEEDANSIQWPNLKHSLKTRECISWNSRFAMICSFLVDISYDMRIEFVKHLTQAWSGGLALDQETVQRCSSLRSWRAPIWILRELEALTALDIPVSRNGSLSSFLWSVPYVVQSVSGMLNVQVLCNLIWGMCI